MYSLVGQADSGADGGVSLLSGRTWTLVAGVAIFASTFLALSFKYGRPKWWRPARSAKDAPLLIALLCVSGLVVTGIALSYVYELLQHWGKNHELERVLSCVFLGMAVLVFLVNSVRRDSVSWVIHGHQRYPQDMKFQAVVFVSALAALSLWVLHGANAHLRLQSPWQKLVTPGIVFISTIAVFTVWAFLNTQRLKYLGRYRIRRFDSLITMITKDLRDLDRTSLGRHGSEADRDIAFLGHCSVKLMSYTPCLGNHSHPWLFERFRHEAMNLCQWSAMEIVCLNEAGRKRFNRRLAGRGEEELAPEQEKHAARYERDVAGMLLRVDQQERGTVFLKTYIPPMHILVIDRPDRSIGYHWSMVVPGDPEVFRDRSEVKGERTEDQDLVDYLSRAFRVFAATAP